MDAYGLYQQGSSAIESEVLHLVISTKPFTIHNDVVAMGNGDEKIRLFQNIDIRPILGRYLLVIMFL